MVGWLSSPPIFIEVIRMEKMAQIFTKKRLLLGSLVIVIALILFVNPRDEIAYRTIDTTLETANDYAPDSYRNVKTSFPSNNGEETFVFTANQYQEGDLVDESSYGYDEPLFDMREHDEITLEVNVPRDGVYNILIDYVHNANNILPNEIAVEVNDSFLYEESRIIKLPSLWEFETDEFILDRYGNEVLPNSIKTNEIQSVRLRDTTALNIDPLLFPLEAGDNTITITLKTGSMFIGNISVLPPLNTPSYEDYRNLHTGELVNDQYIIGASELDYKNNPSIRLRTENDPSAVTFELDSLMLNAIDGYSFRSGNDEIMYEIEVEESGYYYLGIKYRQDYLMQMPVFRELRINGEVPFEEAKLLQFHYSTDYQNILFGDPEPYMFYLESGTHTLALRTVLEPYRDVYQTMIGIMEEITDLSLEIKKLTGNTSDRYRSWDIKGYIPDVEDRFDEWIASLEAVSNHLQSYSHHDNPGEITNIDLALDKLLELRENVNEIPSKMMLLGDGNTSASQLLGSSVQNFLENGLDVQTLFVSGDEDLPRAEANFFRKTYVSTYRFFSSFTTADYQVGNVGEDTLDVWVNHPRQYIEIMQMMIDSGFTEETGIKVTLSLMPDENKLILANAANYAPDVALGVNHWIPYEFAIRGASVDLRQFDGYEETIEQFSKGVMVPYVFEEGMFGLPETQNFWVTFYREDILNSLDIPVPDTWNEVIEILPELQRFDMNYYEPLAFFKGFKPFVATMPFIYQFGGTLYSEDGMTTAINTEETLEGMQMMTDLFTVYNMPKEVPNFYQHFRYGTMPIGISDLGTYLQLTIAAPEIAGKWSIAPHPGVLNEETGEVERWAASGAQASMILSASDQQQESWEFLEWWMSTEVQTNFALRLQTTYGTEYLWNTANLEAFQQLPLPQEHIDTIMTQWEYALEASRIPGAYMVEREISNAWNTIVFDDANPRITLDEATKTANREILYKMEEFDYVVDGVIVKPYRVPTIYNIDYWLRGRGDDD